MTNKDFDIDESDRVPGVIDFGKKKQAEFEKKQKNFWNDKPLGRTLSLRNKTGKTIAGAASLGIGLLTGINIEPVTQLITSNGGTDMEFLTTIPWDIVINYVLIPLVIFLIGLFVKKPGTQKFISEKIEVAGPEIAKAVHEESPGGRKITPDEVKAILRTIFNRKETEDGR